MAKSFYNAKEAASKLGQSEADLKDHVKKGTLREFRDAGNVNYKVDEIDKLAAQLKASSSKGGSSMLSASASGEIVLEPIEDSGINLSASGTDVLRLDAVESDDTTMGMSASARKAKEGTVVPSVGVNVFDDDELDEMVDPLAQTAITDVAGLGIEGMGSGSGILDLTRESDDTSLGAELLEEIYTGEDSGAGKKAVKPKSKGGSTSAMAVPDETDMGEDTRAGLDSAVADTPEDTRSEDSDEFAVVTEAAPSAGGARGMVTRVVEYPPDAVSTSLTAVLIVALVVLWIGGLAAAGMVRGVSPSLIEILYKNLLIFTGASVGIAAIAGGLTYFVMKKREETN